MACNGALPTYIVVMRKPHSQLWSKLTPQQRLDRAAAVRRWRDRHPEHRQAAAMARRMNRCPQYRIAWPAIVAHYGGHCLLCDKPGMVDHVIPLSPGCDESLNQLTNCQPLCRHCNSSKGQCIAPLSHTDHRPDRGAWIAELVRLNPGLHIDHSVTAGYRHANVPATLMLP